MRIKWSHFDKWSVKLAAWLLVFGGLLWMGYSIRLHYHAKIEHWDYFPFVASGLAILFGGALLAQKATAAAAQVVYPFASLLAERLGRRKTDAVVVPVKDEQEGE